MKNEKEFLESEISFFEFINNHHKDVMMNLDDEPNLISANVSSSGAKPVQAKKKNKKIKKNKYKKLAVAILTASLFLNTITLYFGIQNFRHDRAMDYVNSEMVPQVVMNIDGEDFESKYNEFVEKMMSMGLSEESVLYYTRDLYGEDVFDKAVKARGYYSGDDYIMDKGYRYDEYDEELENILYSVPKEEAYERDARSDFIDEVNKIRRAR